MKCSGAECPNSGPVGVLLRGAQKKSVDFAVWVLGSVHHHLGVGHLGKPQPPLILLRDAQKKSLDFTVWVLPRSAQNARKLRRSRTGPKQKESEVETGPQRLVGCGAVVLSDAGLPSPS